MSDTNLKEKEVIKPEVKFETDIEANYETYKAKQLKVLEEFPFIEAKNSASYDLAKKARTALRTARTSIQNEEKDIISNITSYVKGKKLGIRALANKLIDITKAAEQKQQDSVTEYEALLEQKKQAKIREEELRKKEHLDKISNFESYHEERVELMTLETAKVFSENMKDDITKLEEHDFEEFNLQAESAIGIIKEKYKKKYTDLVKADEAEKEAKRVAEEAKRLAAEKEKHDAERAAFEAEKEAFEKEKKEKEEAEAAKIAEEQAKKLKEAQNNRPAGEDLSKRIQTPTTSSGPAVSTSTIAAPKKIIVEPKQEALDQVALKDKKIISSYLTSALPEVSFPEGLSVQGRAICDDLEKDLLDFSLILRTKFNKYFE